jgi:hypothetical protein
MTHFASRNSSKTLELGLFSITYGNNTSSFVVGDYFDFTFDSGNLTGYSGSGTNELTFEPGNYIFEAGLAMNKNTSYNSSAQRYAYHYKLECNSTLEGTLGISDAYFDYNLATSNQSYLYKNVNSSFNLKLKLTDIQNRGTQYTSALNPRTLPEHSCLIVWREI